ncbi:hypothetical protein PENTCL1PPCAC_2078, partial [Pristionchus entomophagus]
CFLASHHCVCLAFETLSGIRMRLGPSMTRTQCYSSIFIYTYCINHQCCLVLVLVCDIAFCMLRPLKYHTISVFPYVNLAQIPCIIFSLSFLIIGFTTMNEETVLACNPPLAYSFPVMDAWNICYLAVNAATVVIYSSALVYTACCETDRHFGKCKENIDKKEQKMPCGGISRLSSSKVSPQSLAAQQRIVKSLSALLIIFCFSWFLGAVAVRGPMIFKMDPKFIAFVQTYAVIPAILSYAQTYYIYFIVSRDYRDAFRKIGIFGLWLTRTNQKSVATGLSSVHRLHSNTNT